MSRTGSGAWTGWIVFAGTMLVIVGMLNSFEGLIALLADERVVATQDNFVVVDLTSWGWTLLIFGLLMIALDTIVIFALTARWGSRDGAVEFEDQGRSYERPVHEPVPKNPSAPVT